MDRFSALTAGCQLLARIAGQNVALSGRVSALADATASPIQPGDDVFPLLGGEGQGEGERGSVIVAVPAVVNSADLLTTSSTPGHCMKATDRDRRTGAILGKAMSSLNEGQGLVLVLVSLQ